MKKTEKLWFIRRSHARRFNYYCNPYNVGILYKIQLESQTLFLDIYKFRIIKVTSYKIFWKFSTPKCFMTPSTQYNWVVYLKPLKYNHATNLGLVIRDILGILCDYICKYDSFKSVHTLYQKARRALLGEYNC